MNQYDRLTIWLREQNADRVELSFTELEALVGELPPSARADRRWWGNSPKRSQGKAWIAAGCVASAPDLAGERIAFERGEPVRRTAFGRPAVFDGRAALEAVILKAGWPSLLAAVAEHTMFLHPNTVEQAGSSALFPIIRGESSRRGQVVASADGRRVLLDDNASPTDSFLWSARMTKGTDVQFNHVWRAATDARCYTALWNLCCTPAFLAKASDTHPVITEALRYRAEHLYGHKPEGEASARKPDGYDALKWAPLSAPVENLEAELRARLTAKRSSRAWKAARVIGWRFSDGPDATLAERAAEGGNPEES